MWERVNRVATEMHNGELGVGGTGQYRGEGYGTHSLEPEVGLWGYSSKLHRRTMGEDETSIWKCQ